MQFVSSLLSLINSRNTLLNSPDPAVLTFHTTWHVLPIYKLDWANEHRRNYVCVRLTGARGTLYPPGHLPERISTGRRNTPLGRLACLPEQVYSFNAPGHKSLSQYIIKLF